MDALHGRHGPAERRTRAVEQHARSERLHDGNRHAARLAKPVELLALRVDAREITVVGLFGEEGVHIVGCGQHVVGGVHTEQDHVDDSGLRHLECDIGVVRGQADRPDGTLVLELFRVRDERAVEHRVEVSLLVNVMDHADIDVLELHALEEIGKRRTAHIHVACAVVLAVLPRRADVALDHEALARVARESPSHVAAHVGVRIVDVHEVDAALKCAVDDRLACLVGLVLEALAADPDNAYLDARSSQYSLFHILVFRLR